jgi:hypothetical protein
MLSEYCGKTDNFQELLMELVVERVVCHWMQILAFNCHANE